MYNNYDIIILCAGKKRQFKNPKNISFIKLSNELTILQRQIDILDDNFEDSRILLISGHDHKSFKRARYYGDNMISVYKNRAYISHNSIASLKLALKKIRSEKLLIFYNDLVFEKNIFTNLPEQNSVFINDRKRDNICVSIQNDTVVNLFWDVGQEWSEMFTVYGYEDIEKLKAGVFACHDNQFVFEGINNAINMGLKFSAHKHPGNIIDIDKKSEIKLTNDFQ